jgi:hypothetical protein
MSAGCVYVLAFDNGTVKVGKTQNVGQRLNAHKSDARKFALTVTGEWVSPVHVEWNANENALKGIAASLGGTAVRPEYFSGVGFAAVVEEARGLPFTPPQCSCHDAHVSRREYGIALEAFRMVAGQLLQEAHAARLILDEGIKPETWREMAPGSSLSPVMEMFALAENKIRLAAKQRAAAEDGEAA